jgi:hypothetical protein
MHRMGRGHCRNLSVMVARGANTGRGEGFASFPAIIASDPGRRTVPTGESSPSRPFPALSGFSGTIGSRSQDPNGHNGPGPAILDRSRESTKAACVTNLEGKERTCHTTYDLP